MGAFTTNDVLFFDVETTGLPGKGLKWESDFNQYPEIVSIAWIYGGVEKSYIIKPNGWTISEETTKIHGITNEMANEKGVEFEKVIDEFLLDAEKAPLVCAHNIYFDTSMIKSNVLRFIGKQYYDEMCDRQLDKGKRIDTMYKTIKFVGALRANGTPGKFPSLIELYNKLFPGETFEAHDALEDVRALSKCLPELVNLGLIELQIKEYPSEPIGEQSKIDFKKPTKKEETETKKIVFEDPEPVIEPIGVEEKNNVIKETPIEDVKTFTTNPLLDENEF